MIAAARKEREVDRAWRAYRPELAGVSLQARRDARAFKQRIAPDADRVKAALAGTALPLINAWAKKGSLDREKKLSRIQAALASASVEDSGGGLLVLWLESRGQMVLVDHPSFAQDCVLVVGAHGTRENKAIRWSSFPIFEAPDHMLARMFQRTPSIDAAAALYEAAACFLRADRRVVEAARLKGADVCLPCGGGLALCLPISGPDLEGKTRLIARAFTWIDSAMAGPDQRPIAAAVDPAHSVLAAAVRGG